MEQYQQAINSIETLAIQLGAHKVRVYTSDADYHYNVAFTPHTRLNLVVKAGGRTVKQPVSMEEDLEAVKERACEALRSWRRAYARREAVRERSRAYQRRYHRARRRVASEARRVERQHGGVA